MKEFTITITKTMLDNAWKHILKTGIIIGMVISIPAIIYHIFVGGDWMKILWVFAQVMAIGMLVPIILFLVTLTFMDLFFCDEKMSKLNNKGEKQ